MDEFFRPTSSGRPLGLIEQFDISFVYHGPEDRNLGELSPDQVGYLQRLLQSDGVSLSDLERRSIATCRICANHLVFTSRS